ncbi:MAG TPA: hypothetical protein PLB12_12825 [Candidatus Goldiibacteriota bacterium]|nr:hypothetical protein [Candidatus Goldiibacteriota bacterium]
MKKLLLLFLFVVLVLSIFLNGCSNPVTQATEEFDIYYTITSSSSPTAYCVYSYTLPDGNEQNGTGNLPITTSTYKFKKGQVCSVLGTLSGLTSVTVSIYKNGVLWKTMTSSSGIQLLQGTL